MFVHERDKRDKSIKVFLNTKERDITVVDKKGRVKSRRIEITTYDDKSKLPVKKITVYYKHEKEKFMKMFFKHPVLAFGDRIKVTEEKDKTIVEPMPNKEDVSYDEITD